MLRVHIFPISYYQPMTTMIQSISCIILSMVSKGYVDIPASQYTL